MTGPTSTNETTSQDPAVKSQHARASEAREEASSVPPAASDSEIHELARTQEDVAQRARRLVAGELVRHVRSGHGEEQRSDRCSTRSALTCPLNCVARSRSARQQLAVATRSSADAGVGFVGGVTTIVRSIVPAVLVRPEDAIEATFALADQGLRVVST